MIKDGVENKDGKYCIKMGLRKSIHCRIKDDVLTFAHLSHKSRAQNMWLWKTYVEKEVSFLYMQKTGVRKRM